MDIPDPERMHDPSLPPLRARKPTPEKFVCSTNGLPYPDTDLPPQLQRTIFLRLQDEPHYLDTTDEEAMEETLKQFFAPDADDSSAKPPAEE